MLTRDGISLPYRLDDQPVLEPNTHVDTERAPRLLLAAPFGHANGIQHAERSRLASWRERARAAHPHAATDAAWAALAAVADSGPRQLDFLSATLDELAEAFADAPTPERTPLGEALAASGEHPLVVGLFALELTPRDLAVLEGCAALGARLSVAFAFGAGPGLARALAGGSAEGPLAARLDRLRGQPDARWVCLFTGSLAPPGAAPVPGSLALALCFARSLDGDGGVTNFIGLETGGALGAGVVATDPAEDAAAWTRRAEAGLASVCRAPDGRLHLPGVPTLARPPDAGRDWSRGAATWAARRPWVSPLALGRQLETQLPWVLFGGVFLREAQRVWRTLAPTRTPEAFSSAFGPWFGTHQATEVPGISAPVRRRRPIGDGSRAELEPVGRGYRITLLLTLHAVGDRPGLAVTAQGFLPGASSGAPRAAPVTTAPSPPTSREAALLAAVYADPDDDAARLVYADLLLERSDPRGELIALQYRRAEGRSSLQDRDRERALLDAHAEAWLGALARVVDRAPRGGPPRATFERGFAERLTLGGPRWLHEVHEDPAWATLRALDLAPSWAPADTLALVTQPALRGLRELGGVTDAVLSRLADEPPPKLARIALREPAWRSGAQTGALLARFSRLGHLAIEAPSDSAELARALDRLVPPQVEELTYAAEHTDLSSALASAQRTSLRRFVFRRRSWVASFELAFSPGDDGRLSVLTVEACEGDASVDVAVQCLDALPGALVSRATVAGSELRFAPRLRHALRRFE